MLSSTINNKKRKTWKLQCENTKSKTHITQYMKVHSEKQKTWYMKVIWKIQYKFPDVKIDLRDGTRPDSHVTALEHFIS